MAATVAVPMPLTAGEINHHERLKAESLTTFGKANGVAGKYSPLKNGTNDTLGVLTSTSSSRIRLDPHRALQPARKKLSTLEAQRIMAALATGIRRAELASSLPKLAVVQKTGASQSIAFGSELARMIEEEGVAIGSYNELRGIHDTSSRDNMPGERLSSAGTQHSRRTKSGLARSSGTRSDGARSENGKRNASALSENLSASRNSSRPVTASATQRTGSAKSQLGLSGASDTQRTDEVHQMADGEEEEEEMEEENFGEVGELALRLQTPVTTLSQQEAISRSLELIEQKMSQLCRNILRAFLLNPPAADVALNETPGPIRSVATGEMIRQLKELKDYLTSRLLTTPVEDAERSRYLREVNEKERHNAVVIAKLTAELQATEEQRDAEIAKQNEIIRRLQAELHQIERASDDAVKRTRLDAERQEAADKKNCDGKMTKLQLDLGQVRAQYSSLLAQHRDSEQALRKRKFQVETEVENWIQKYDGDMGERQDEYEQIDAVYTEEKLQLNELEERFRALEVEYRRIMDERRAVRETREAAERELQMCVRAALTIQAFWRSFKVRKAIKAKKKRGTGGGRVAAAGGSQKKGKR